MKNARAERAKPLFFAHKICTFCDVFVAVVVSKAPGSNPFLMIPEHSTTFMMEKNREKCVNGFFFSSEIITVGTFLLCSDRIEEELGVSAKFAGEKFRNPLE